MENKLPDGENYALTKKPKQLASDSLIAIPDVIRAEECHQNYLFPAYHPGEMNGRHLKHAQAETL